MVDPRRYLPFDPSPLRALERRLGHRVATPVRTTDFETAGVGHSGMDGGVASVEVFVFDHIANRRSSAWHWPRVRTESIGPDDDATGALERATLEFMQNVLRGDSMDDDVMLAVEAESERRLSRAARSGAVLELDGRDARCRRISWDGFWFTSVDTQDPLVAVTVIGPASWCPELTRVIS